MRKRKKARDEIDKAVGESQMVEPAQAAAPQNGQTSDSMCGAEPALAEDAVSTAVESPEAATVRLTVELEEQKDRYLRLAADFDNYRKRVARDRNEVHLRAQADIVSGLLEALDNLARVTAIDPAEANGSDLVAGVELVERKLLSDLENRGLTRVGSTGDRFDPNDHEAVSTMPAPDGDKEGIIAAVFQVGYRFGGSLLRPARVQVFVAPARDETPEA